MMCLSRVRLGGRVTMTSRVLWTFWASRFQGRVLLSSVTVIRTAAFDPLALTSDTVDGQNPALPIIRNIP